MPRSGKIRAALAAATALIIGSSVAAAAEVYTGPLHVNSNAVGEAGYFINDFGNWHIRDAHAVFTVTAAMEAITTNGSVGGVGGELCDPNDDFASQDGLIYIPAAAATSTTPAVTARFDLAYGYGTFTPGINACVQSGLLFPNGVPTTQGGVLVGPDASANGQITINVGDVVSEDDYYNPRDHVLQYSACDVTQDVCRQARVPLSVAEPDRTAEEFFEAGVGVLDNSAPNLVSPPSIGLVHFSHASFTNYNKSAVNRIRGGWELEESEAVNAQSAPVLVPSAITGNSFSIMTGSVG